MATIFICYYNYRSAKAANAQVAEMKRQSEEENRPYITVEIVYENKICYILRFSNYGRRIANHVNIQLRQDFIDSILVPEFKAQLNKMKDRECIIGVGQHYDLYLGSNELRDNPNLAPISGCVTYCEGSNSFRDEFSIELKYYTPFFSMTSNANDPVKALKAQTDELRKIRQYLETIALKMSGTSNEEDE